MSVYKPFITSDIVVSPFELNKSFSYEGAAALTGSGINRYIGENTTTPIYVSGSNLAYFTKYSGTFPEVGGLDNGRYPLPKRLTIGAQLAF